MQIGDVGVRGMTSEQVAVVLRQLGVRVWLVVARAAAAGHFVTGREPASVVVPAGRLDEQIALMQRMREEGEDGLEGVEMENSVRKVGQLN